MTSLLVLEAVDSGQLTLDQPITASTDGGGGAGGKLHRQSAH